ncbi:hypothetical protein NECAME_17612 [Necator americanus]|uniref:Uncharacterized protein n=1 Tax=Necator americanus TaxID=51031 RepID=W2TMA4_NECAM|nr:hypothetical protein NECAME_17612 [Necator americanus]ETN82888.1 hypothetical protein NECAME_17612 [Necator americanus]
MNYTRYPRNNPHRASFLLLRRLWQSIAARSKCCCGNTHISRGKMRK